MRPSPTELALMKPLWAKGALSARELHDAAGAELGWSFSSTRRTLDRMIEKGLARTEERHGVKVYLPAVGKVATLAAMTRAFMGQVMEIDQPSAAAFTGSALLSEAELDEMERLLAEPGAAADGDDEGDGR